MKGKEEDEVTLVCHTNAKHSWDPQQHSKISYVTWETTSDSGGMRLESTSATRPGKSSIRHGRTGRTDNTHFSSAVSSAGGRGVCVERSGSSTAMVSIAIFTLDHFHWVRTNVHMDFKKFYTFEYAIW